MHFFGQERQRNKGDHMKKLLVFGLLALGVYFSAFYTVKIQVTPNMAQAGCEPECYPPKQ